MREITTGEVQKLDACLRTLAKYHNAVSTHFKEEYPSRPYEETLQLFADALARKSSLIAVAEDGERVVGFCKVDFCDTNGKLDYLVVQEGYRGMGFGRALMDWAMQTFDRRDVHRIEVKVVDGNATIHLYEKYGFRINAHILVKNCRDSSEK